MFHFIQNMPVNIQGKGGGGMAHVFLYGLNVILLERKHCVSMPLWHNKDKSENPCVATGWLVCPYSFSTKNGPQMGSTGGSEKLRLHLKDKFFQTEQEVENESLGHHCKAK